MIYLTRCTRIYGRVKRFARRIRARERAGGGSVALASANTELRIRRWLSYLLPRSCSPYNSRQLLQSGTAASDETEAPSERLRFRGLRDARRERPARVTQFEGIRAHAREIFRARGERFLPGRVRSRESYFLRFSAAGVYFRRGCPPSRRRTAGGLK